LTGLIEFVFIKLYYKQYVNKGETMNGICHIEIPSKDFEKAKKFYGEIFGWKFKEMKEMNYLVFEAPDGVNGGFTSEIEPAAKPGILIYIEVEDIPATIKKSDDNGGATVVGKTQISPEHGYFAMLKDLEGNQIGLWAKN